MTPPNKTKRIGNSFAPDEILAAAQLFRALRRGADVRALLRSPALQKVEAKFHNMEEAAKSGARARMLERNAAARVEDDA